MKNIFIFKFLFAGLLVMSQLALADDPQFPFAAADTAFSTAVPPASSQLQGQWTLIGLASNPQNTDDLSGYWPDGKFQLPNETGYFYQQAIISNGTTAFGTPSITWDEKRIGVETGHVYSEFLSSGSITSTGAQLDTPPTDTICAELEECRFVQAQSMLLCRLIITDTRRSCRRISEDDTEVTYMGYKQLAATHKYLRLRTTL